MIPVRLELKNFMSYGENVMPLEFTGMHLACLSGDNGHGKSAILDAITWALWGEARASGDELIRLGTDEMRVTLDFEVGGDLYRVIRGKSKRGAGNMWEVYISDKTSGWRPITGQGIRDTGKVIQRILRMDYKTFINSAYIQQGRADEFTKQSVADRKKILADILDLSRYDLLEQKAKDRRNEAEQLAQEFTREIAQIEGELGGEEGYKAQLAESKAERATVEEKIETSEGRFRELQVRQVELNAVADRVRETERQISSWRQELGSLQARKSEQERRVSTAREIVRDREDILDGLAKLRTTRKRLEFLDKSSKELSDLKFREAQIQTEIMIARKDLESEQQAAARELSEVEFMLEGAETIEKEIVTLRAQVNELDALDWRRGNLQAEVTSQSDQFGALKAQYEQMLEQKRQLEEKLSMISQPGAKCPLCQAELGHEKHETVVADYRRQIEEADLRIAELRKGGADAKKRRDAAQQEADRIDATLKSGLELRKRLAQADQVLMAVQEAKIRIPELRSRVNGTRTKLESEDFAQDPRARLKEVSARIGTLEYDEKAHQWTKSELANLERYETLAVKLQGAEDGLPADEEGLRSIDELIAARGKSIADSLGSIELLSKSMSELPLVSDALNTAATQLTSLRDADRQITGRIATLEQSLDRCKGLRKDLTAKRKKLEKSNADKEAYQALVTAFGKKGVQALIIENAIPEIQDEANRLLARMTDNAMQVIIETIRDKKTGGTAETLDIRISDDMGTRAYELYSGGEAFRVNFTLRIALSKLLARRAGARLQTLIIDEGFGTQDARGREKLTEAIDSIKDDFEKILVITHIDELKDAFPTRIEITKDEHGSQISVG